MKAWPLFVTLLFAAAMAYAEVTEPAAPACAVQVVIDLQTYGGPKHFENFCLTSPAMYGDGLLSIEAISAGDGIFANGFDPEQL